MNECKLVQDLFPLYHDNELSAESAEFVRDHLENCPACRDLLNKVPEISTEWEQVEPPAGSTEKFMLRWKRRRQRIVTLIFLAVILVGAGAWYYGQWSSQRVYLQQEQAQKRVYSEQLAALQGVSPPPDQLLKRWGISMSIDNVDQKSGRVSLNYSLGWNGDSPVDRIDLDRNNWFDQDLLINGDSGAAIPISNASWGGGPDGFSGSILTQPLADRIKKLVLKTHTLFVLLKGTDQTYGFDYAGGQKTIAINKQFAYQGVDFSIDSLQLGDKTFVVRYHQVTPATKVGVFQLDFTFDDRLGNSWSGEPELAVTEPKEFSLAAPHSPAKHWDLKIAHVIQVIPGVSSNIDLKGGTSNGK